MSLLVTNHAHVLACISRDPEVRLRDVALRVGLTERAVQRLVNELDQAGFLVRVRVGRRNRYQVLPEPLLMLSRSLSALVVPAVARGEGEAANDSSPAAPSDDGIARNHSFID